MKICIQLRLSRIVIVTEYTHFIETPHVSRKLPFHMQKNGSFFVSLKYVISAYNILEKAVSWASHLNYNDFWDRIFIQWSPFWLGLRGLKTIKWLFSTSLKQICFFFGHDIYSLWPDSLVTEYHTKASLSMTKKVKKHSHQASSVADNEVRPS